MEYHFGKSIAIIGPDGAGKSTLAGDLAKEFEKASQNVTCIYGSKKKDQYLWITKVSYNIYELLRGGKNLRIKLALRIATLYLVLIHYPIELMDNILMAKSVRRKVKNGAIIIYDRHPVDRLLPLTEIFLNDVNNKSIPSKIICFIQVFYAKKYLKYLHQADVTIILLPSSLIIYERRKEFYKSNSSAELARKMYIELSEIIERRSKTIIIDKSITSKELMAILKGGDDR